MDIGLAVVAILLGYLLGSVPSAYILLRLVKRIDIRTTGSGNVGALNTYQQLGPIGGIGVLLADVSKGVLAVYLPMWIGRTRLGRLWQRRQRCGRAHLAPVPGLSWGQGRRDGPGRWTGPGSHTSCHWTCACNNLRLGHQEYSHWGGDWAGPGQHCRYYHRGVLGISSNLPGPDFAAGRQLPGSYHQPDRCCYPPEAVGSDGIPRVKGGMYRGIISWRWPHASPIIEHGDCAAIYIRVLN